MAIFHRAAIVAAALGLSASGSYAQSVKAIDNKPDLTAEAAKIIGDTCVEMAKANGWHQAITVLNARQQILYFYRMDGTSDIGAETSGLKAKTAFFTHRIGRDIGQLNPEFLHDRGMLASPGGIPILVNGLVAGAVGVGGGVSINDHKCGMAGLEKVGLAPTVIPPEALTPREH
jgi:glc operon protein GlcG